MGEVSRPQFAEYHEKADRVILVIARPARLQLSFNLNRLLADRLQRALDP
jgi:hypothetical protein